MKVRCSICGMVFPSEYAYLNTPHDTRVHDGPGPKSIPVIVARQDLPRQDLPLSVVD